MYCSNCGGKLHSSDGFCYFCGSRIETHNTDDAKIILAPNTNPQERYLRHKLKIHTGFIIVGIVLMVCTGLFFALREDFESISRTTNKIYYLDSGVQKSFTVTMNPYADPNIQEYWYKGRIALGLFIVGFFCFIINMPLFISKKNMLRNLTKK